MVAEVESGRRLKVFRTDRGGEFNSGAFVTSCSERGIKHNCTTPYSPQQTGVVERWNQTIVEMARCSLKSMRVPSKFWGEAVKAAVYLLNQSPTKSLNGKTLFEAWFGEKPGVRHLHTFGYVAYAKRVGPRVTKLVDRSTPGVFPGYEPGTKGYRVCDPVNDKLMVTRDVILDEKKAWNWVEDGSRICVQATTPYTFTVQYPDKVHGPAIGCNSELGVDPIFAGVPASPAASIPSAGNVGDTNTPPHTPISGASGSTPPAVLVQWATPPTNDSADSDGGPRRYRTIPNLLDTTEEIYDIKYSGFCLVVAEEPRSIEEAMIENYETGYAN